MSDPCQAICYLTNISRYVRYYLSTLMRCTLHDSLVSCPRNGGLGEGREKRHHRGGRGGLNAVCWAAHLGKPGDPEENAGDGLETWRCQGWNPGEKDGKRNTYGGDMFFRSSIIFRIKDQDSGALFKKWAKQRIRGWPTSHVLGPQVPAIPGEVTYSVVATKESQVMVKMLLDATQLEVLMKRSKKWSRCHRNLLCIVKILVNMLKPSR